MSGSGDRGAADEALGELLSRGFEPPRALDGLLVALAALDVLALLVVDVYAEFLPSPVTGVVLVADLVLVGVFAAVFVEEAARASDARRYARTHWYDLVGLIPVAHWVFRVFRLVDALRIRVVQARPVTDSPRDAWWDGLARLLFARYRDVQVDEIAEPIVLTSLERLREPLAGTRWTEAIGGSLADRRREIRASVEEAVAEDPHVGRLARTRPGRYVVDEVADATLAATVQTLRSEEVNEALGAAIDDALDGVRSRVEATAGEPQ